MFDLISHCLLKIHMLVKILIQLLSRSTYKIQSFSIKDRQAMHMKTIQLLSISIRMDHRFHHLLCKSIHSNINKNPLRSIFERRLKRILCSFSVAASEMIVLNCLCSSGWLNVLLVHSIHFLKKLFYRSDHSFNKLFLHDEENDCHWNGCDYNRAHDHSIIRCIGSSHCGQN